MRDGCLFRHLYLIMAAALLAMPEPSRAVPSFARQTNMACNGCHSRFPELTPFGRVFKMNGYALSASESIDAKDSKGNAALKLLKRQPVSFMLQASHTHLKKSMADAENNSTDLPQQLSAFIAGQIAPSLGTFIQITYDDQGTAFGWDNAEVRFARAAMIGEKSLVWGLTLNNNPTVQDVWNTTPAWGFPYAASYAAPAPDAAALIEGGLAQNVAGLGAYAFWNNMLYGEISLYRSAQQGGDHPPDAGSTGILRCAAPYWRLAYQEQWGGHFLEVGAYGLNATLYPEGISGSTVHYTDAALDLQYERTLGGDLFSLHSTFIDEKRKPMERGGGVIVDSAVKLRTFRIDGNYYFGGRYGTSLAYFTVAGGRDPGLYGGNSRTGKPDSKGGILEFQYLPWMNARLSLQYVHYTDFNGSASNYDGTGRNARDNDSFYLLFWLAL